MSSSSRQQQSKNFAARLQARVNRLTARTQNVVRRVDVARKRRAATTATTTKYDPRKRVNLKNSSSSSSKNEPFFTGNYRHLPKKLNTNRNKYTRIANRILKDLADVESKLSKRPLDRPYILSKLQGLNTLIKNTKEEFAIDLHNRISSGLNQSNFYYNQNTPLVNVTDLNRQIPTSTITMYSKIINSIKNPNLQKNTKFPAIVDMDAALMTYDKQMKYWNAALSRPRPRPAPVVARNTQPVNTNRNGYVRLASGPSLMNRARTALAKRRANAAKRARQNNINAVKFKNSIRNIKKNVSKNNSSYFM
jgi:hypothetical protein